MAKAKLDRVDKKILSETPEGRAYLEYNDKIGGEPFGYCVGMPFFDIEGKYGGLEGLYRECIRQGKTWEELLGTDGHWDWLPLKDEE